MSESIQKIKILVTGRNGQLGSELRDILKSNPKYESFILGREELPLNETESIYSRLEKYKPEILIHAGAYTAVDLAEDEPEQANVINHLASQEIAKYCQENNVKLVSISTDYIFDGNSSTALREDAAASPINTYGLSKLLGERVIQHVNPSSIIIRTSWVYSTYGKNFVKTMLRLMQQSDQISVVNDQIGSPTYAKDLAEAILFIIESEIWIPGIYHYSNEGAVSWYDFALSIREISKLTCDIQPVNSDAYPTRAVRPRFSLLDKSKIKTTFGLQVPEWRDSLKKMILNTIS